MLKRNPFHFFRVSKTVRCLKVSWRTRLFHWFIMSMIGAILLTGCSTARSPSAPGPDEGIAYVHVNVIPMDRERVLVDQTVIVRDGRIYKIGPAASTEVPDRAAKLDANGRYLFPALTDMHVHMLGDAWNVMFPPTIDTRKQSRASQFHQYGPQAICARAAGIFSTPCVEYCPNIEPPSVDHKKQQSALHRKG